MNVLKRAAFTACIAVIAVMLSSCGEKKTDDTQTGTGGQPSQTTIQTDTAAGAQQSAGENIVRQGSVDLAAIDRNHDGKVLQCPMDYNVVADAQTPCPVCKMDLEEVTLARAGENLKGAGFQTK